MGTLFRIAINYVIEKAFSWNISGNTNLAHSEKVNLRVPIRLFCQGLALFLGEEKSAKSTYFATGRCLSILP